MKQTKEYRKIDELRSWKKNPRGITTSGYKRLEKQIKKLGQYKPLLITNDGVVIGGNMRLLAYRELKVSPLWVSIITFEKDGNSYVASIDGEKQAGKYETIEQGMLEYALSDNDRAGYYEEEELAELLYSYKDKIVLPDYSIDIGRAIDGKELLDKYAQMEEDEVPEIAGGKPKSKLGEVYQLGKHRLMCGDATKKENFEKLMEGKKANLIFTDPPYNVDYKSPGSGLSYNSKKFGGTGGKMFNDDKTDDEAIKFYSQVLKNLYEFSAENVTIYWWFANTNNWINRKAFKNSGWHMSQIIIWLKNSLVFSRGQDYHRIYEPCMMGWKKEKKHYTNKKIYNLVDVFHLDFDEFSEMLDVWYEKRDVVAQYVHPTQKPVRLAERALKKNSKEEDIVLDAFGGSGSTLIACEQMNRKCYMMELDPKYVDVIIKRWENYTGKKVKKVL